ncbi:hypothetical protein CEXT_701841 [Caerostris extrusa]|uniref:Uncharacterized protein n=1 Tax=Caerostris extrusa TaxID=172846 RepID=A0AAV4VL59_CAEEX|nr:hypothetical protein CEXT_701841 [Caerostris extrusa]
MTRIFPSEKVSNQCSPNFVRNLSYTSGTNCDSSVLKHRQNQVSQRDLLISCYSSALNFDEEGDCLMSQPDGE